MTPLSSRDAAGDRAGARAAQHGLQILMRLSAALRIARSYQPGNQVVVNQLDSLRQALEPVLEETGEAVVVALHTDLYLNGARIPYKTGNVRFHRHLLDEFEKRRIAGFRVQKGLTTDELTTFFRLFTQPDVYAGPELLKACLAQGADHILPAIHASTEAPDDNFEYDLGFDENPTPPASDSSPSFDGAWAGVSAEGQGGGTAAPRSSVRGAARKGYAVAVQGARSLLMTTSLQGGMELRHAKRVVQPLVDGAFSDEPVVVGLSTLGHHDEYTYAHAVNVCLVAVSMGHFLEMDRRSLADLGVAALLHDVGKAAVGGRIHHTIDAFTEEERELASLHPVEGAKLLARSTTLNRTTLRCMRVALEHHIAPDGSGYPRMPGLRVSLLSRLVAVADCYVSLQTHRSARGTLVTPYQALGMMLGPLKPKFDPAILWALVQTVGFYPPGQLVEIDDGSVAVVLAPNAKDLARPHVRVVVNPFGQRLAGADLVELRPLPADRSIRRALRGEEYPADEEPGAETQAQAS